MKKVRVLQLITGLPIGGAEKVLLDLCSNLDQSKVETFVIGLNDEDDLKKDFESEGIFVEMLNMRKTPANLIKVYKILTQFVQEHEIDIIHAHMFHPLVFAYLLKMKNPKLKIVFTSHNEDIGGKFRELFTYTLKNYRDVDIVFSKEMITKMYTKDTVVVVNGVDLTASSNTIGRPSKNEGKTKQCALCKSSGISLLAPNIFILSPTPFFRISSLISSLVSPLASPAPTISI